MRVTPLIGSASSNTHLLTRQQPLARLGRANECELLLADDNASADFKGISRVHASLRYDFDKGELYLEDQNSQNGTKVGDVRLAPGQSFASDRAGQ